MPKWGMTMQEGTLAEWEVAVGDSVQEGQPLAAVSTDKVDSDVEAPVSGTVTEICVEKGASVAVGTVLCRIETA